MGEMKIGVTDPKVLARTIIVNHGQALTHDEVGQYVFEALGDLREEYYVEELAHEVWNRIQDADVTVSWDDDEPSTSAACDGPCCGGPRY